MRSERAQRTCKSDGRKAIFKRHTRNQAATFIDQGFCFNAGEWTFPDSSLRGVHAGRGYMRASLDGRHSSRHSHEPSRSIFRSSPDLQCTFRRSGTNTTSTGLNRLIEALYRRRSIIRGLINDFRKSNRNPFPNWMDK